MSNIALNPSAVITTEQHQVLKNTFRLLGISMIPTVIGAYIGMQSSWDFIAESPVAFLVGYLILTFGLILGIKAHSKSGVGVAFLLLLTLLMGIMLGPILQAALQLSNGSELIMLSGGGTALAFFGLSAIATNPNRDFSSLGGLLFVGLIVVILAAIANIYFQIPALSLTISAVSILIFAGYTLYDVNQIIRGGETNYIIATLNIYLDIYNMFVNLLRLLMSLSGE